MDDLVAVFVGIILLGFCLAGAVLLTAAMVIGGTLVLLWGVLQVIVAIFRRPTT